MLESKPGDAQILAQEDNLIDDLRRGTQYRYEQFVLQLIISSYRNMYGMILYDLTWKENTFSAVLTSHLKKQRQDFARQTRQHLHIGREVYNDDELISSGKADPDKATRIDIVIYTWRADYEEVRFPFECKLLDSDASHLIRLYIKKGLIDRYLTEKDYARGTTWGGMIGFILKGEHAEIVYKLNSQIDRQLNPLHHLSPHQPIDQFDAIYTSKHPSKVQGEPLIITHLFLAFRSNV